MIEAAKVIKEVYMDEKQAIVEAWKQTVAVQMHFNDLAIRIRSIALTAVAALLTVSGLDQEKSNRLVIVAALILWVAFYLMDRWWYYPLLYGSVTHGIALEVRAQQAGLELPGEQGADSANSLLGLAKRIKTVDERALKLSARYKMDIYYALIGIVLIIVLVSRL
jgi:uncharacterized membrane protein